MESKVVNAWVDPTTGDEKAFLRNYYMGYGASKVAAEILKLEESMKDQAKFLVDKEKGESVDSFKIGA